MFYNYDIDPPFVEKHFIFLTKHIIKF